MDVIKLYNCLSDSEKYMLKNLLKDALNSGKTDILEFIGKYENEIIHSTKMALIAVYKGKYRYKCTYIEDLEVSKLTRISGIGEHKVNELMYLIIKHKNSEQ